MRFMDLEQPEYSYMFGFLQADGTLTADTRNRGRLSVEVSTVDREILVRFRELCPYPSSIRERTRSTNFKAEYTSSTWTMCALEGRGIVNSLGLPYGRKSTTIRPPTVSHSPRDYIRGLVDADGAVGFTANAYAFVSLTTSSEAIARYFCEFGLSVGGAERNPRRNQRDNVFNTLYTNEPAASIARELYYEGALTLSRKAAKGREVAAWQRPSTMRARSSQRRWTPDEDAVVSAHPPAVAAAMLGRSEQSCGMRRWRLLGPAKPWVRFPQ